MTKEELEVVLNPSDPYRQAAAEAKQIIYLGVTMLCGADQARYRNLVEELHNYFTKVNEDYPANATESYNIPKMGIGRYHV